MDRRTLTTFVLFAAVVLHAASAFRLPGFFQKGHAEKMDSPPNNKPIPVDSHIMSDYTGPIFIIRERVPSTENIENEYEAFVTTGGIHLSKMSSEPTSSSMMAKNNMDKSQVRNHDESNNSDAEDSSHFGVIVNSETISKLQLSDLMRINVTLNSLLKAATSGMPWLLVLQRKKIKEMAINLGNQQKHPEKESVERSSFAVQKSQPKINSQPQRRLFRFVRQRRAVHFQSDTTTLLPSTENNYVNEEHAFTPTIADGIKNVVVFPEQAKDKVDIPPYTIPTKVDVAQVKPTQASLATIGTDNPSSPFSLTGTIHNHNSFVFSTEVTDNKVISTPPYVTFTDNIQVNYHPSDIVLPSNQQLNSIPSPDETTNKDNPSTSIISDKIVETTTNVYSPDINDTGTDNFIVSFPIPTVYPERVSKVDHLPTKVVQETTDSNQSLLPMTVSNRQFNTPQPVLATTSVVSNKEQLNSSASTETTNLHSAPCSLPITDNGIIKFKDVDDEMVIPIVQPERLMSILCEHINKEYRQMNTHEELPKPEAMTDITGIFGLRG